MRWYVIGAILLGLLGIAIWRLSGSWSRVIRSEEEDMRR
jgi:hypothetical protein